MIELENGQWWLRRDQDTYRKVNAHVSTLEQMHAYDNWEDRAAESLYENPILASGGQYSGALTLLQRYGFTPARLNITRSIVDSALAHLGKRRPSVKVTPDDADWSFKLKARQMTRFGRSKFELVNAHDKILEAMRDGMVRRAGCLEISSQFGEITLDVVPIEEMYVDKREAKYGTPRSRYRRFSINRHVAMKIFPKHAAYIKQAPPATQRTTEFMTVEGASMDMIEITRAIHLPSKPTHKLKAGEKTDGREVYTIHNRMLWWDDWDRPTFPWVFYGWAPSMRKQVNPYFTSLVSLIADIQYKINEIVMDIQQALYYGSQLHVWVQKGTVPKNHLGRTRGPTFHEIMGPPPKFEMPNVVAADAVAFLEKLEAKAHDIAGVSERMAFARNDLGAGASGIAMQERYDWDSQRLFVPEKMTANLWRDVFGCFIDEGRDVYAENKNYSAKWHQRTLVQVIPWKKIHMERDQYQLKVEPSGFFPETRAGKLQTLETLAQSGYISGAKVLASFNEPDLEKLMQTENAVYHLYEFIMELLADPDEDMSRLQPDPYMAGSITEIGIPMARSELFRATIEGAPDEVLDRYRDWIDRAEAVEGTGEAAAPADLPTPEEQLAQGMMPGGPQPPAPDIGGAPVPPQAIPGAA